MSKIAKYTAIILGLLLLAISLCLIKTVGDPQGIMASLPYVCIGIGSGLFGHGMGNLISERAIQSDPDLQKKLMVSFALMDVDMIALLLLVFAYLFVHGFGIYYRIKFDKEM